MPLAQHSAFTTEQKQTSPVPEQTAPPAHFRADFADQVAMIFTDSYADMSTASSQGEAKKILGWGCFVVSSRSGRKQGLTFFLPDCIN